MSSPGSSRQFPGSSRQFPRQFPAAPRWCQQRRVSHALAWHCCPHCSLIHMLRYCALRVCCVGFLWLAFVDSIGAFDYCGVMCFLSRTFDVMFALAVYRRCSYGVHIDAGMLPSAVLWDAQCDLIRPQDGPRMAPGWPQDGPKRASRRPQEGPKRDPRGLQEGPRMAPDGAGQGSQRGPWWAPSGPKLTS